MKRSTTASFVMFIAIIAQFSIAEGIFADVARISADDTDGSSRLLWKFEYKDNEGNIIDDIRIDDSCPVIGPDGTIYTGSYDRSFYAINPDGSLKWRYTTDGPYFDTTPAIGPDGTIYIGDGYGVFHALNPDSTLKWRYYTNRVIGSAPAIGSDGTIYIGSTDGFLYALNPDGTLIWKHKCGRGTETSLDVYQNIESSPAIGSDGTIYVTSADSYLYALNPWGTLKWKFKARHFMEKGSPSIGADGTIYITCRGHRLYALSPEGVLQWEYEMGDPGLTTPIIAADGTIYAGAYTGDDTNLHAIDPDGSTKWIFETGSYIESSAAIGSDGTVYFGSHDGYLYAVNPDGTLKWRAQVGGIASSPSIAPDGTLYIGCGTLYAFQTDSHGYQDGSSWPCFMHNNTRSISADNIVFPALYTVRGQVALPDSTPLVNVEVSVGGLTTDTDEFGYYSFLMPDGDYTVTINITSALVPQNIDFTVEGADVFISPFEHETYTVTGRLLEDNKPLSGIPVTVATETVKTDSNGYFSLNLPDGNHTLVLDAGAELIPDTYDITVDGTDTVIEDIVLNRILWSYELGNEIYSPPVVGADGTIYFIIEERWNDKLIALNPDGSLAMEKVIDHQSGSFMISKTGDIILPSYDSMLVLNPDGTQKWSFPVAELGVGSNPAEGKDGTLYFGGNVNFFAVSADGILQWTYETGARSQAPVIGDEGMIYVTGQDGVIHALNPDGSFRWKYTTNGAVFADPAIDKNGIIYVPSYDLYLHAINPDGTVRWMFPTEKESSNPVIFGDDGTIFHIGRSCNLYAIDRDGSQKWFYTDVGYFYQPITWGCDGSIYTVKNGLDFHDLYSFSPDGKLRWKQTFECDSMKTPVFTADGTAYVAENRRIAGGSRGYLHAIKFPVEKTPVNVEHIGENNSQSNQNIPKAFTLGANFPNPFNPATFIPFSLTRESIVTLSVFDITGRKIATLADGIHSAGNHVVIWDASGFASGVYIYRLKGLNFEETRKMLLVK